MFHVKHGEHVGPLFRVVRRPGIHQKASLAPLGPPRARWLTERKLGMFHVEHRRAIRTIAG